MSRIAALLYGAVCYAVFFGTFLYAVGFLANVGVPKSIDSGPAGPTGFALLVNAGLLALFAVQHSGMARPGFKKVWTRVVPRPVERSTYVLLSSLALIALFAFWQPLPGSVWNVTHPVGRAVLYALFLGGVATVLYTTFLIDHFDLFGLRQVVLYFRGIRYTEKRIVTPSLYRHIRHPLYVGWFITFWATPAMSVGHLILALGTTAYILAAIPLEERDLIHFHGEKYRQYRDATPRFVPALRRRRTARPGVSPN